MTRSTARSQSLAHRAASVMPGGVSSPVRAFRSVSGTPVHFARAAGSRFHDVDGNDYVDFCMSWGPLVLGHAHPVVVEAVREAAGRGLTFGACHAGEAALAERVLEAFPGQEQVRFVSSGTEAVMTALRLARGATGRPLVLKFDGGYHGHVDSLLVRAGSGLATFGTSSSGGVSEATARDTIVVPLDDDEALEAAFAAHGDRLAAAIVEPLPANNGLLEQRPEWLRRLRELCTAHGALLIFDEVISGFRFRFGGYGDLLGIPADLVTLGKIVGGGMPVGAVAGPRRLMELLAPLGPVYQAGTLSGNPVALAAGAATLDLLRDGSAFETMEALGRQLDEALAREAADLPFLRWRRLGSVTWLHLAEEPVPRRADRVSPEAVARFNAIHRPLLDQGIYLPPSAYEVLFLSTAHRREDVETLARTLGMLLRRGGEAG